MHLGTGTWPGICALLLALPAFAVLPPAGPADGGPLPDWDIRGMERMNRPTLPTPAQMEALRTLSVDLTGSPYPPAALVVQWGPQPGTLHHLFRRDGFLTEAVSGPLPDAESTARRFLMRHRGLLGLSESGVKDLAVVRRMEDPGSRAVHLQFEQRVEGVEIFLGEVRVHIDREGRVLSVGGDTAPAAVRSRQVRLDEAEALVAAARSVRVALEEAPPSAGVDARGRARFEAGPFESEPWVDPTWFPMDDGLVRAWRVIVDPAGDQGWYQLVVDAATGDVLHRYDLVENVATERLVFREDPGQGPQELLPFIDDTVLTDPASPLGWTESGESEGNNCDVKDDHAADNEATIGARAAAAGPDPLSFSFPFNDDPGLDLEASITNLFWLNSRLHDWLARLGFDEPAGNFQDDNFGRGGRGGDRVRVDAQDGSGTNNANFGTPPDGSNPRMQMFIWTRTNPNRDSGFDASVVTHELFHGVSNRLVGGGDNAGCLGGAQAGAMGEGWSDFFPCSVWDQPTVGGYLIDNYVRGIRRSAYDTYPYDYGQLCNQGGFEVHRDGEIWAAVLWDIRELFIRKYGFHSGRCRAERLVLDGMKLSVCRPTYTDMRDAILLAGRLHGRDGDLCLLWQGFAGRGMGVDAVRTTGCTSGEDVTSYDVPAECADCDLAPPGAVVLDTSGPNRVRVQFTPAPGADEHILLRSTSPCPGHCLDAEYVEVARGPGDAAQLLDADGEGNRLSAGQTFSYRVLAVRGTACTAFSDCAEATITGRCTLRPEGAAPGVLGVTRLSRPPSTNCTLTVDWAEARSLCGNPNDVRYNIYRSEDPAFTPGPENLLATVAAPSLSYADAAAPAAAVTYVVRAEDRTAGGDGPHGGNEEANDVRRTLAPQGQVSGTADFSDDAEAGELPGYRRTGAFQPNDWQVLSDGNTRGGSAWHVTGQEGGTADKNLHMPPLSLAGAPRLTFAHIFDFEDRFDGGVLEISTDGGLTWRDLLEDFTAGGYETSGGSGTSLTVGGLINPPNTNQVWTGENASGFGNYDAVEVDLAPYAGTLDAQVRFRCLLDPLLADPGGWYVDDILVEDILTFEACADACAVAPRAVLDDVSVCGTGGEPTVVVLDGSRSEAGASGFAPAFSHVFTHDGPGSFDGARWAEGLAATLTFPAGTPPGDYPVTLTVRDAETCASQVTATVTLEEGAPPPASVGNTLVVARIPGWGLGLRWDEVGAVGYNIHLAAPGEDLSALHETAAERNVATGTALLDSAPALPGGGSLFIRVYATTSCGASYP